MRAYVIFVEILALRYVRDFADAVVKLLEPEVSC
jgi:hypothetical protein